MDFSDGFTRMPQRTQDCPGVLDYVCSSLSALTRLGHGALKVVETPSELSDHHATSLILNVSETQEIPEDFPEDFTISALQKLKMPVDASVWSNLDSDLQEDSRFQKLRQDIQIVLSRAFKTKMRHRSTSTTQ